MTSEGLGKIFEGNSADTCGIFPVQTTNLAPIVDYSSSEASEEEDLDNLDSGRDHANILNEDCEDSIIWSCSDASDSDENQNIDDVASINGEDVHINDAGVLFSVYVVPMANDEPALTLENVSEVEGDMIVEQTELSLGDGLPVRNRDLETPPSSAPTSPPTAPSSPTPLGPRTPTTICRSVPRVRTPQERSPFRSPAPDAVSLAQPDMRGALTHR